MPKLLRAVPQRVLDEAVSHVLATKYDLGLFHDPFRRIGRAEDDPADVNAESRLHRADARAMIFCASVVGRGEADVSVIRQAPGRSV